MARPSLRVCTLNRERFSLPTETWEQAGCEVEIAACLAQCGDCEACPFAEVDGNLVFADTLPKLLEQIPPGGVPSAG
jgi:hypothetical protein